LCVQLVFCPVMAQCIVSTHNFQIYDVSNMKVITSNSASELYSWFALPALNTGGENSSFVPYWTEAQLLVEGKMGHDGGFL